jgi:hypothetical protein
LIPLYVLTELSHLKEKVLISLLLFRKKYLRGGHRRGSQLGQQSNGPWSGDGGHRQHSTETVNGKEDELKPISHFNSAKYLFTSWRVAALFPELPESGLILQFHTPWPRKKFGVAEAEVAREYDQAILLTALSRMLLFFLTSLLHYHTLVQDLITQLVSDSSLGVLVLICIHSAQIHPLLPVAEALVFVLCLGFLLRLTLNARNRDLKRFETIQPMLGEEGEEGEGERGVTERGEGVCFTNDPVVPQGDLGSQADPPPDHRGDIEIGSQPGTQSGFLQLEESATAPPLVGNEEPHIEVRQPTLVGRLEVDLEMGP